MELFSKKKKEPEITEIQETSFVKFDSRKCIGCEFCEFACPIGAIKVCQDDVVIIDNERCIGCYACVDECPTAALYKNII